MTSLTREHAEELLEIESGADIYGYGIAIRLRAIAEAFPDFIEITDALDPPENPRAKRPYFGAIATPAGIEAAQAIVGTPA